MATIAPPSPLPKKNAPFKGINAFDSAGFTINTESSDSITVNVQLKNHKGEDVATPVSGRLYVSDDSVGLDPCATPLTSIAAGTDGAITQIEHGSSGVGRHAFFTSEADGDLDVVLSISGAKTCYLVIVLPDGGIAVSSAITFAA